MLHRLAWTKTGETADRGNFIADCTSRLQYIWELAYVTKVIIRCRSSYVTMV